jgi:hypothetical protein
MALEDGRSLSTTAQRHNNWVVAHRCLEPALGVVRPDPFVEIGQRVTSQAYAESMANVRRLVKGGPKNTGEHLHLYIVP